MLYVFEGDTFAERFPAREFILVLLLPDGPLEFLVVASSHFEDMAYDLWLALAVGPTSEFVEDREQKDDLIPFVEEEKGVLLYITKCFFVFSSPRLDVVVVF